MPIFLSNFFREPNPIFLKEARQSVRGWIVPVVLVLELLALTAMTGGWLCARYVFEMESVTVSPINILQLFDGLYWTGLVLTSWLAGWSLLTLAVKRQVDERESLQSGLIFLTRLTAGQFLRGLWLAGMAGAVLPLLATLPFWALYCWFGRVSLSAPAMCLGGQALVMGVLFGLMMIWFSAPLTGRQLHAWRRGAVFGCLVLGLGLAPSLMMFFYYLSSFPHGMWSFFDRLVAWFLPAAGGSLVLFYAIAWAQVTISVRPNSRAAGWSRSALQLLTMLVWVLIALPLVKFFYRETGLGIAVTAAAVALSLCFLSCWKIQRLGHPAQEGLWLTLCRFAGRCLAGRRKPQLPAEESFDPASGSVKMKLAFIERWPIFDGANPILIKEMRQMFRNLTVPVIVGLGFASCLLGLIRTGQGRFYFQPEYAILLAFLSMLWLFVIISNLTEHTREEAQAESRDLLFVTLLTPGQIVRGKWGVMVLAALAVLLAMLPHALLWCVVSRQWLWVLVGFAGFGLLAAVISLALLILALFPLSRTVFQFVMSVPMFLCFLSMAGLDSLAMLHSSVDLGLAGGGPSWWLRIAVFGGGGLLLVGIVTGGLYSLATVVAGRHRGTARWMVLVTLGALPVLLLAVAVVGLVKSYGFAELFPMTMLVVLAAWIPWRIWFSRTARRPRRLAEGG